MIYQLILLAVIAALLYSIAVRLDEILKKMK